jgi:2',3'-cyclic-nucleotide 2'-phosphodiesterase (5'-nucleotidase family)
MNRIRRILFPAALLLLLPFFLSCSFGGHETPAAVEIAVLHVNDTHGHIVPRVDPAVDRTDPVGGAATLAAMIETERGKNPEGTVLLSGGDMFQGTPVSDVLRGKPVIEIMNLLRFDAMAVGNHEFDWGMKVLEEMIGASDFPFLSANIVDGKGEGIPGVKPWILLERKGLKIAVIGLTTPDTPWIAMPKHVEGLAFLEPEKVLPGLLKEVRAKGAAFVIVLSHLGVDRDRKLAAAVPGIPLIVGGHSHKAVEPPLSVGGTLIVQAKGYGDYLGVLRLRVEKDTGRVLDWTKTEELKTVRSGPGDPLDGKVANVVASFMDGVKETFGAVVGSTRTALTTGRRGESLLGDLVCDAMRDALGAAAAFYNAGGIRADLSPGAITLGDVYDAFPFDNVLVAMDLTGADLMEALEQSAGMDYGILQLSGMKVRFAMGKPKGARVSEAFIGGKPLDGAATYRVVVQDFLAGGGDHFRSFRNGKNVVHGELVRDAVVSYVKKRTPLDVRLDGRIEIVP